MFTTLMFNTFLYHCLHREGRRLLIKMEKDFILADRGEDRADLNEFRVPEGT